MEIASYRDEYDNKNSPDKLVCTVDHLQKDYIRQKKWDLIVFDECALSRAHMISSTVAPRLHAVLVTLDTIISNATKIVLTQHDLCTYIGVTLRCQ